MAEGKKSFLMYADWETIFDQLEDAEAGVLIKHILKYVNDRNPSLSDRVLNIAFQPIKLQLKRDLKKWENEYDKKSDGGKLGNLKKWHLDLYTQVIDNQITIEQAGEIIKTRKLSDTDTKRKILSDTLACVAVNVNDNVTVNVTDTVNNNTLHNKVKLEAEKNKNSQNGNEQDFESGVFCGDTYLSKEAIERITAEIAKISS